MVWLGGSILVPAVVVTVLGGVYLFSRHADRRKRAWRLLRALLRLRA